VAQAFQPVSAQAEEACGYRKSPLELSLVAIRLTTKRFWSAPETGVSRFYTYKTEKPHIHILLLPPSGVFQDG
jgi:hypothetical protein